MDRRPRTTQERRTNGKRGVLKLDGYLVKIRGRRSSATLVEAWDDIPRQFQRSWKRFRKTRYK